jgi:hypothetical protein
VGKTSASRGVELELGSLLELVLTQESSTDSF